MLCVTNIYLLFIFNLVTQQSFCTLNVTPVQVYCSREFFLEGKNDIICAWITEAKKLFNDTYYSALEDCPKGYSLDDLTRLKNLRSSLPFIVSLCNFETPIWIILNKSPATMTIYSNSTTEISSSNANFKHSFFLCGKNGYCDSDLKYYDTITEECYNKKNESFSCIQSVECIGDLNCSNNICQCLNKTYNYFDYTSLKCVSKTLHNTLCLTNKTCRTDLGLSCQNGTCQCLESQFWHSSKERCFNPLTYGNNGCSSIEDCLTSLNLICNDNSINNSCNCPKTSITGMCDCPFDNYWNGNQCVPRSIEYQQCNSSIPFSCISGLTCDSCSSTCQRSGQCLSNWIPFKGKCYKLVGNDDDYDNLVDECLDIQNGAKKTQLAVIDDIKTLQFLKCKLNIRTNGAFINKSSNIACSNGPSNSGSCKLVRNDCVLHCCNCNDDYDAICEYNM